LSRAHAHIIFRNGHWYLKDLLSINGTCLNLQKLNPFDEVLLKPHDHIYFGNPHQSFFIEYEFLTSTALPLSDARVADRVAFPSPLRDLSDDLWSCRVFSQLSLDDLIRCRLVSHQWRARIDASLDLVTEIRWDGPWPLAALQALLQRKTARALAASSQQQPLRTILRSLTSEGSFQLNDATIQPLAALCGAHLLHLDISGSAYVSNLGLNEVASACVNLERVSARGCKRIGFDWGWLVQLAQRGRLVEVDLHATGVNDAVVCRLIEHSPMLRSLACGVLLGGGVSDVSLRRLAKCCPELTHLDVRGCKLVTDEGVVDVVEHLSKLESLVLRSCNVGDAFLRVAGRAPRALITLDLHRCTAVTDDGVVELARRGIAKLQHLDLSNLTVSDRSLLALAKCDSLRSLDLRSCRGVSGAGVLAVVLANSATLRKLDLNGCVGVTPSVILEVAGLVAGTLRELEVGGSTDLAAATSTVEHEPAGWLDAVRRVLGPECTVHDAFHNVVLAAAAPAANGPALPAPAHVVQVAPH